uniref:DNA topoisomerase n=1 Tax=viral metagenome TaxID=1070528 RepID=A0A6C0KTX4_9ZZZZ
MSSLSSRATEGAVNLVIVESAAKGKTIAGYLNSINELKNLGKFNVMACFGHICDLPQKELGVNTDTWDVTYIPLDTKKDIIAKLRKAVKEAKKVYLCSDLDMEGHAISFHLRNILKLKRSDYERVTFNEITKAALKTAFMNPTDINMKMVNAQETRRILDRVVGYKLSPLLWGQFTEPKLSAGRVQSAALNMIVDRAEYINKHIPEVYWDIYGTFILNETITDLYLKLETEYRIEKEEEVIKILQSFKVNNNSNNNNSNNNNSNNINSWIATFKKKKSQKNPAIPFITSSLQQEVYQKYHIPAKRTMQIAQNLYELGLITYMRTDSPSLSEDCQAAIHKFLEEKYNGDDDGGASAVYPRVFEGKDGSQEAHESIHPTDIKMQVDTLPDNEIITANHKKIYDLIWRRTVASQMPPAIYTDIIITVKTVCKSANDIPNITYIFTGKISILTDKGFLDIYQPDIEINEDLMISWNKILEDASGSGVQFVVPIKFNANADATRTQSLYNESSLIKALEKENIGRPSTYATIIDKIYDKGYVKSGQNPQVKINAKNFELIINNTPATAINHDIKHQNIEINIGGKETDRIVPTALGIKIIEYLKGIVPYLLDAKFTSEMEDSLDKIATNKADKITILNEFYKKFEKSLPEMNSSSKSAGSAGSAGAAGAAAPPIREFPDISCNIVNSKYGVCIYSVKNKKFYSLKPYLEWKKIEIPNLVSDDIKFLICFPIKTKGTKREIHIGKYGLYIKEGHKNLKLPNNLWEKVKNGTITKDEICSL